ncbi:MAG TPA: efflux RND transporter periplasmic adaptor subunit [Gammaproteobacteria bacterium]|nr:efflux RND transporter periplasmic adaptor subunit [Gammaproteobacteria bacterium]
MSKNIMVVAVIMLAAGLGGGYWLGGGGQNTRSDNAAKNANTSAEDGRKLLFYRNPMNPSVTSPVPAKDSMGMDYIAVYAEKKKPEKKEILFYRNAMNPGVTSPVPAKDSMGMDYIPVYAEGSSDSTEPVGTVKIDPVTVQNIGVRTARAEQRVLSHQIHAVGRVDYNEERLTRLHPKTEGWIEKLYIDKTGEFVTKDTILLGIYSPQLVSSQQEYLLALNNHRHLESSTFKDIRDGANELLRSSRERLELLDVPEHQIRELEQSRKLKKTLHIHSPFDGIVMNIGVREGQYVTPNTELYMLADLTNIWVYVDIYENELSWVKVGDTAKMKVTAIPGEVFTGKVTYIYPYLESKTRTNRVRLEFNNQDLRLKPEMFANVTLMASRQVDAIVVPSEAIVRSGTDNQLFVVREPGKFEPRTVILGVSSEGMTQILSGVKPGEEVVTSSQFLIDSESKLREATQKMMDVLESEAKESVAKTDKTDKTE